MSEAKVIYAGDLRIEGWHRRACEVLSPLGISTCISSQSNNLLQKVTVAVGERFARMYPLGGGRYAINTDGNGMACTLTGANRYSGNIIHPRQGFREMGVLEIQEDVQEER